MFKPIFINVVKSMYLGKREHYTVIYLDGRVVRTTRKKELPVVKNTESVYVYPGWSKKMETFVLKNIGKLPGKYMRRHHITRTIPNLRKLL